MNLFNTFRSYIDMESYFPVKLVQHTDVRGSFVETVKIGVGGQVSFSTTVPGVTRGNHYHTRKMERFVVIKGKREFSSGRLEQTKYWIIILTGKNRLMWICRCGTHIIYRISAMRFYMLSFG